MNNKEKLADLLKQREALKQEMSQELKAAKKQLADAQRKRKAVLEKQIRIARVVTTARERKTETRRKILVGAMVLSHVEQDPPAKENLFADLNDYLERDRDRELFNLPPKDTGGSKIET